MTKLKEEISSGRAGVNELKNDIPSNFLQKMTES